MGELMDKKLQHIKFLMFINLYLDMPELDMEIKKLTRGVPYSVLNHFKKTIEKHEDIDIKTAKIMCLIFLLHITSTKKGYVDQAIRNLITTTKFDFNKENIEHVHAKLKSLLIELGIEPLKINKTLVRNIGIYSPEFRRNNRELFK